MPEMDGFEVIRRVGQDRMPLVVFVTAFDAHALHAFDVHALDYVLKPFDDARFREAVARARQLLSMRRAGDVAVRLRDVAHPTNVDDAADAPTGDPVEVAANPATFVSRITVKRDGRIYFVPTAEIEYVEAAANYVKLHARGAVHPLRSTIRALAAQLDPQRFTRIHKSTIVNVERIREVQPWFGGDYVAILLDGTQLRVSRTYVPALLRPYR
jgi:two-component system LytT family response regulator